MLRSDTSPAQDHIKRLKDMVFPGKIQFSACNNTKQGMEKTEGHAISVVPDATVVPSGVVHLMELQEQGWSYVRPSGSKTPSTWSPCGDEDCLSRPP